MPEKMVPTDTTLVKYENPVLVTVHDKISVLPQTIGVSRPATATAPGFPRSPVIPGFEGVTIAPPQVVGCLTNKETEEILNVILPPREWEEDGKFWRQTVSSVPATRVDVINLQEHLDMKLKQKQARETGICPIRRDLYSQCFDELIRQITINCAERGLLLLRVRDEFRMTLSAYQGLYESSTAYGMRKALMSESGKADIEARVHAVTNEKRNLSRQVQQLKNQLEQIDRKHNEQRDAFKAKHENEISLLQRANQQLRQQLEALISPPKKT